MLNTYYINFALINFLGNDTKRIEEVVLSIRMAVSHPLATPEMKAAALLG